MSQAAHVATPAPGGSAHTHTQGSLRAGPEFTASDSTRLVFVGQGPRPPVPGQGILAEARARAGAALQGETSGLMSPGRCHPGSSVPRASWLGLSRSRGGWSPVSRTGGQASGGIQWASCSTRPAGHWQPGTQGLTQSAESAPRGTCRLKQVRGQGGPHSSNTKPRSRGQPTTAGRGEGRAPVTLLTPCSPPVPPPSGSGPLHPPSPCHTGRCWLTTERRAPPGRRRPRLATVAGIGFQGITEAGVSRGARATGTQVVNTGGKEGLRRHHGVAATERGGLQHPAPGMGLTPGSIACCSARVPLSALGTGPPGARPLWDLRGESGPGVTASLGSWPLPAVLQSIFHPMFCFSFENLLTRTAKAA